MMDEVQKIIISLPAHAEYVDIVRLNLYGVASKMGFSYEEIEDMKVAVSEACNHSVLYAYKDRAGMIEVVFEVQNETLSITVRDEGESFEVWEARSALHDTHLGQGHAGGLGFYLMEALMDDVSVLNEAGKGNKVVMTRRLVKSEERV